MTPPSGSAQYCTAGSRYKWFGCGVFYYSEMCRLSRLTVAALKTITRMIITSMSVNTDKREYEWKGQPVEPPGVSEPGLEPAAHHKHREEREQRNELWETKQTYMDKQWSSEIWQDMWDVASAANNGEERLCGVTGGQERTQKHSRFSAASPMMIFPPLLLVFSTESAVLRPCSCFPRPWPSLKPYFCMILWATVPLHRHKTFKQQFSN